MPIDPWFRDTDFTLRQLQYAVAVAEHGGFGVAAEACGVSQPSLSAQVAKLEGVFGVQLFERRPREVVVTGAGRLLLERARVVMRAAHDLEDAVVAVGSPWSVPLAVGVIPTVAPYLLPPVATELASERPEARVHWQELQTHECEEALATGPLDAAVIADAPGGHGMVDHPIGFEPFVVVVPADHPLQGPVSVAQLSEASVLLLEDGHCLRDHTMDLCLEPGATTSPYRATSLPTLVQMVAAGLGVSVLPSSAVAVEGARARVRVLPFAAPAGRTLRLVWRQQTSRAEELELVARCFSAALSAACAADEPSG